MNCCKQLEIDTKDICLLCLGSRMPVGTNSIDSQSTSQSLEGLKNLLRYLKVSPKELFNCSSEFLQSMEMREDIDLKISLCSECSSVTEKFNKLYQQYELIQLRFGSCVQSLHESISKGNQSPERVRKYKYQMRPITSSDLVNASIAANLRNETLKKCSLKLQSRTPRVTVALQEVSVGGTSARNEIRSQFGFLKLPSGTPRVKVALQKQDVEKCTNLPKSDACCSISNETNKHEANLGLENIIKNAVETINEPVNEFGNSKHTTLLQPEDSLRQARLSQMSTKAISEIEVIAGVTPVKRKISRKNGYFDSIRKKLKTRSQPTATTTTTTITSGVQRLGRGANKTICEFCKTKYSTQKTLKKHLAVAHSENIIINLLPSNVSLKACKLGLRETWEQMFQVSTTQCHFCMLTLYENISLKRHLVFNHAEEFAIKVLENVQSIPNYLELTDEDVQLTTRTECQPFVCEYCNSNFRTRLTLKHHKHYMHPELIIYKYFPPHIPLASCRQGVQIILEQMLSQASEYGFQCKFCPKTRVRKIDFKSHVVSKHGFQIALEAQQSIGLVPECFEVESSDPAACSSTSKNHEREHNPTEHANEFNRMSKPLEMDIEIEEETFMKIENPPPEIVESDPLDLDYFD